MLFYCALTILLCTWHVGSTYQPVPLVNTPLGDVRGYYMETRGNRKIHAFTALPFALPPLKELRFKAPVPVARWESVYDATKESPLCVQRNPYTRQENIVGQEDCLYLNVYSPNIPKVNGDDVKLLPVMVWFHGGGWMCGGGATNMYGPEYLLDKDIVYVAINYRLGPLGFLSTLDEHCPGNNGLKDQQEALRWIQKNIHSFGGDNNSVTLFGESAGGASTNYHMLSPTSAGLFHKAISQSGTALVPWAEAQPGEAQRNAKLLAKLLNCPETPSEVFIECLRTKDSYDIIGTEYDFYVWDYEPMTPFKAVVEPNLTGAFITKNPRDLIRDAPSIPWMTGLTKDEGCLKSTWIVNNETRYQEFSNIFDTIAPVTFYYENVPNENFITKAVRDKYLNGKNILGENEKRGLADIYKDNYFSYPALESIVQTFKYSTQSIYLYQLNYKGTNSFSQIFGDEHGDHGVCHADDLMHLFPITFLKKPFSKTDREISDIMITLWTNFATSGNPNKPINISVEWKPLQDIKTMDYLEIDTHMKMSKHLAARAWFWDDLPLWHKIERESHYYDRHVDEL